MTATPRLCDPEVRAEHERQFSELHANHAGLLSKVVSLEAWQSRQNGSLQNIQRDIGQLLHGQGNLEGLVTGLAKRFELAPAPAPSAPPPAEPTTVAGAVTRLERRNPRVFWYLVAALLGAAIALSGDWLRGRPVPGASSPPPATSSTPAPAR